LVWMIEVQEVATKWPTTHSGTSWRTTCGRLSPRAAAKLSARRCTHCLLLAKLCHQPPPLGALRRQLGRGCAGGPPIWQNTIEYKRLGPGEVSMTGCVSGRADRSAVLAQRAVGGTTSNAGVGADRHRCGSSRRRRAAKLERLRRPKMRDHLCHVRLHRFD
jgi:hypothetical protein